MSVLAAAPSNAAPTSRSLAPCQTQSETGAYPPGSSQIGLQISQEYAGQGNTVTGGGYAKSAGATVALQICSAPESLGTATLRADGSFSQAITIPADIPPGQHTIQASGPNANGGTLILTTQVTILANPGTATDDGNGSLPLTGLDLIPLILAAVLLIATGAGLVVVVRDKRRQRVA